jgi:hypothetical protein
MSNAIIPKVKTLAKPLVDRWRKSREDCQAGLRNRVLSYHRQLARAG